jgi:hypothetical protein
MNQSDFIKAFDELTSFASDPDTGKELSRVALTGGTHEKVLQDTFVALLSGRATGSESVQREVSGVGTSGRVDIAIMDRGKVLGVVEVKAPMTNHDGVRNKTRKPEHLPKDCERLHEARRSGVPLTYELVGLIEAYGLNSKGQPEPPGVRAIRAYEADISKKYRIKWPTRHDYRPAHGRQEVDDALLSRGLKTVRGWSRCQLPSMRKNSATYLDLALFQLPK